jgi:hypothetical protein
VPKGWTTPFNDFRKWGTKIGVSGGRLAELEQTAANVNSTGVDQYNMLFQFVKSRDDSVVRASELDLLKSADPVLRRLAQYFNGGKITKGQIISPGMAKEIVSVMRQEWESDRQRRAVDADVTSRALSQRMTAVDFDALRAQYGLPPLKGATPAATPAATPPGTPSSLLIQPGKGFTTFKP